MNKRITPTELVEGDAKGEKIKGDRYRVDHGEKVVKGNQQLMLSRKTLGAFKSGYLDRSRLKSAGEGVPSFTRIIQWAVFRIENIFTLFHAPGINMLFILFKFVFTKLVLELDYLKLPAISQRLPSTETTSPLIPLSKVTSRLPHHKNLFLCGQARISSPCLACCIIKIR